MRSSSLTTAAPTAPESSSVASAPVTPTPVSFPSRRTPVRQRPSTSGRHTRSQVIFTLDADLQDDPDRSPLPCEDPRGYDLVSGWKAVRHDPWQNGSPPSCSIGWSRRHRLPLHDFNCGFKAYTRRAVEHLSRYGELTGNPGDRVNDGGRVAEIPVRHHPRRYGRSSTGSGVFPRGSWTSSP